MQNWFNFVSEVGNSFEAYVPIVEKRKFNLYTRTKKIGRRSDAVVMSSSIWFTIKGTLFGLKPTEELKVS
jgi:coproporphyrinogen III oxidase